jgi:DNA-binding winged helix-turn-helix (wHTH) protein
VSEARQIDGDLVDTLEAGAARLRSAAREIGLALEEIETAIGAIRHIGLPPADRALERLLEAQHDRLARTLLNAIGQGREAGAGEAMPHPAVFPFRMEPEQRTARIGRRRIPLTESEYKVLELLWEQMPAPVPRQALVDRLYGERDDVSEAVIDMFIFKIRSKLRAAGCTDAAIKAIRGKGWVLDLGPDHDDGAADD